jgi:hypothetical protein
VWNGTWISWSRMIHGTKMPKKTPICTKGSGIGSLRS